MLPKFTLNTNMARICFALLVIAATARTVADEGSLTDDWTQHIIPADERSFDFKMVSKGAAPEHSFILKNPFQETLVIKSVTSSCTCTTVHFEAAKTTLQTYEEIAIGARFRGDLFDGQKNATLTIVLDKPKSAEIQLNVRGEIRADLQVSPTFLDFGNVEIAKGAARILTVTYTGSNTLWRLVDAWCENEFIRAEITNIPPVRFGIKEFKVNVSLDSSAPNGTVNTSLLLVSNDAAARREIPIPLRGTVGTVIRVNPSPLFLGLLSPDEKSPLKNVTLRGTKPFRITKIECNNPAMVIPLQIDVDAPANRIHSIPIQYDNPPEGEGAPQDGIMVTEVRVTTDVPDLVPTFYVTMRVRETETEDVRDEGGEAQ